MTSLLLVLVGLAVAATQALAGGRQMILCLPGYGLLALAAALSWWPRRRTPIPRVAGECVAAAVVFCGYISVRAYFSPEEYLARKDLFVALGAMALYLVVALNLNSARLRLLLVAAILALALANCGIGAVQFFKGQNYMPFPFLPRPDYGFRASGFYGYPNHLSGFLEMALMMGLSIAFWSRWPFWAKILVGYICVMCLLGILFTGSRGGYIAGAVGLMAFVLLSLVVVGKLASGRVIALLFAGMLVIGGVGWGVRVVMSKSFLVQSRADQTLTVDASRMRMWQAAWKQFRLQPVVGTGSGTYLYYGRQFRSPQLNTDPVHAHNDYIETLAEYGIIGIFAAIIFLETHLRTGWNSFTGRIGRGRNSQGMNSNALALNIGALSAAAACLVHSLLDYNLHMPANVLTAALIFGLLATPAESPEAGASDEEPGFPPFLRLALPALGISMAVLMAPTAPAEYYAQRLRAILSDWQRSVSPEPNREMESLARRGLARDPRNPELYFAMGEAQSALGDLAADPQAKEAFYAQAVESYRKALELAPGDVHTVLRLASSLDSLRRFPESEPLFTRALLIDPSGGVTHNVVAHHFLSLGKLAEAERQFRLGMRFGAWEAGQAGLDLIQEEIKTQGRAAPVPPKPEG